MRKRSFWFVVLFFGLVGLSTAQELAPAKDNNTLETAKIVDVNDSLRAVVLNVGRQVGVRIGMPFVVLHGERVVAQLKVVEVRDRVCAAKIEKIEKNVSLKAGDSALVTKS